MVAMRPVFWVVARRFVELLVALVDFSDIQHVAVSIFTPLCACCDVLRSPNVFSDVLGTRLCFVVLCGAPSVLGDLSAIC